MDLNNHETALLLLLTVLLLWSLSSKAVRKSVWDIILAFFDAKILLPIFIATMYITFCVWLLSLAGIWRISNLKTTILWGLSFALVAMFNVNKISKEKNFFQKISIEIVSVSVFFTFITELYDLSLTTELIIIPLLTFLSILSYSSQSNPNLSPAKKFIDRLILGILLSILIYRVYNVAVDYTKFLKLETLRELTVPIDLSFAFIPFLYFFYLYVRYESLLFGVGAKLGDGELAMFAKFQAAKAFGFNLASVEKWVRLIHLSKVENRRDILYTIHEIKLVQKREKDPTYVSPSEGWSPYKAKDFLTEFDLATRDYHWQENDTWYAGAGPLEFDGDGFLPKNSIFYHLEGNETVVKTLQVSLNIARPKEAQAAKDKFFLVASTLFEKALGKSNDKSIIIDKNILEKHSSFISIKGKTVSLKKTNWTGTIKDGYTFELVVKVDDAAI